MQTPLLFHPPKLHVEDRKTFLMSLEILQRKGNSCSAAAAAVLLRSGARTKVMQEPSLHCNVTFSHTACNNELQLKEQKSDTLAARSAHNNKPSCTSKYSLMRRFLQDQQLQRWGPHCAVKFDQLQVYRICKILTSGWKTQDLGIYMAERVLLFL